MRMLCIWLFAGIQSYTDSLVLLKKGRFFVYSDDHSSALAFASADSDRASCATAPRLPALRLPCPSAARPGSIISPSTRLNPSSFASPATALSAPAHCPLQWLGRQTDSGSSPHSPRRPRLRWHPSTSGRRAMLGSRSHSCIRAPVARCYRPRSRHARVPLPAIAAPLTRRPQGAVR